MKPRTFLRFRVRTQHWSKLNPRPAPYPSVVRGRPESRDYARDSLSHMLLHTHELKANPPEKGCRKDTARKMKIQKNRALAGRRARRVRGDVRGTSHLPPAHAPARFTSFIITSLPVTSLHVRAAHTLYL